MTSLSQFKIVVGKRELSDYNKTYMERIHPNGNITYHNYKERTHPWQTKYGPYHTIREKGGTATFYNIGNEIYDLIIQYKLDIEINSKSVGVGYNF